VPKIKYDEKRFGAASLALIDTCNRVIEEYTSQGYVLTLRQLFYQLVSRDVIPNQQKEYKRLGAVVNDARLSGLIDWECVEDRTRHLESLGHWTSPSEIVETAAVSFSIDHWRTQRCRIEVWVEKDALVGVIEEVCNGLDVPYFSCRGYTSQSEMWSASQRLKEYRAKGQTPVILHLADHDPSGRDMTRDISDRMRLFMGGVAVERLALNMNQVRRYNPPPNPAKTTDARYAAYIAEFGENSWELDALEPAVIDELIRTAITNMIDRDKWKSVETKIRKGRATLSAVAKRLRHAQKN